MKKSIYILTLIILSLLSMGATVQAQNAQKSNKDSFNFNPDGSYSGDFKNIIDLVPPNHLKYFNNINGIKRINDNTIMIKPDGYTVSPIRIEVDKGRISCGIIGNGIDSRFVKAKENTLINPTSLHSWIVSNLNENEKQFTIKIYNAKNDVLLAEKTFQTKDVIPSYYAQLIYTDVNGNEQTVRESVKLNEISVNYDIPMKISVYGPNNKTYKVNSFILEGSDKMGDVIISPSDGNLFSTKYMAAIRNFSQSNSKKALFITNVFYIDSEGRRKKADAQYFIITLN